MLFFELLLCRNDLLHSCSPPPACIPRLAYPAAFPAPHSQCEVPLRIFPAAAVLTLLQEPVFAEVAELLACWVACFPLVRLFFFFFKEKSKVTRSEVTLESQASSGFRAPAVAVERPCKSSVLAFISLPLSEQLLSPASTLLRCLLSSLAISPSSQEPGEGGPVCPLSKVFVLALVGLHPLPQEQNCPDSCIAK